MKKILYSIAIMICFTLSFDNTALSQDRVVYGYVTGSTALLTINADSVALWLGQFYNDGSAYSAGSIAIVFDGTSKYYCTVNGSIYSNSVSVGLELSRDGDTLYRPATLPVGGLGGYQLGGNVAHRCLGAPCSSCSMILSPTVSCSCLQSGGENKCNHEIIYYPTN